MQNYIHYELRGQHELVSAVKITQTYNVMYATGSLVLMNPTYFVVSGTPSETYSVIIPAIDWQSWKPLK